MLAASQGTRQGFKFRWVVFQQVHSLVFPYLFFSEHFFCFYLLFFDSILQHFASLFLQLFGDSGFLFSFFFSFFSFDSVKYVDNDNGFFANQTVDSYMVCVEDASIATRLLFLVFFHCFGPRLRSWVHFILDVGGNSTLRTTLDYFWFCMYCFFFLPSLVTLKSGLRVSLDSLGGKVYERY